MPRSASLLMTSRLKITRARSNLILTGTLISYNLLVYIADILHVDLSFFDGSSLSLIILLKSNSGNRFLHLLKASLLQIVIIFGFNLGFNVDIGDCEVWFSVLLKVITIDINGIRERLIHGDVVLPKVGSIDPR